jgi:cyclic pyranopterin monophosphate synthase
VVSVKKRLTHLTRSGEARMVDVGAKPATRRRAVATARVEMTPGVLERVVAGEIAKGDVLAVARVAGIQAAKKTPELIPLCHTIALTRVEVAFEVDAPKGEILVRAEAEARDRTGVEMEALVAAGVAALTIYDMVKSVDRWMSVREVRMEEKSGGRSGLLKRSNDKGEGGKRRNR